jgi:hypothetical protein
MIEEARRLPPSMLAVGIAFVSLFVVLVLGTIVAVLADDTPQVPALEGLPVIDESEIVDSISTCTDAACDGFGVLLMGRDLEAPVLTGRLTRLWRSKGWRSVPCVDEGGVCFADKDLRISVRDWDDIDPVLAPTLVEGVADRDLDAARLLYVHYYRCGVIYACE